MKILSPLPPWVLCQGHVYLVQRSQSLSSSSVSTFSNTINSHPGGHHYFNVKKHLGTNGNVFIVNGDIFKSQFAREYIWAAKRNQPPFCIMLAFVKILSPLPPRALCQGHVYLVLRSQSLSSSSVSTFSNTINSQPGGHHYFNVKMHLGTKAFSTETIWRKKTVQES